MVGIRYELSRPDFLLMRRVATPWYNNWPGWLLFGIFGIICLSVGAFGRFASHGEVTGWWFLPALFAATVVGASVERWWRHEQAWQGPGMRHHRRRVS